VNIENKTVILTGASGGLGTQLAKLLAARGARLILVGRDEDKLSKLVADIGDTAHQHCILTLDLSCIEGIRELVEFCAGIPTGIDVLINNAGINHFSLQENLREDEIEKLLFTNLISPVMLTTRLIPLLASRSSALIVNVGSVLGAIGNPGFATYGASKAGLARFSEALARELHDGPINVMQINPRSINTGMNSENVSQMNHELGIKSDSPEKVAMQILNRIVKGKSGITTLGWPEQLFVKLNALLPTLIDQFFRKNLDLIKSSAVTSQLTHENEQTAPADQPAYSRR